LPAAVGRAGNGVVNFPDVSRRAVEQTGDPLKLGGKNRIIFFLRGGFDEQAVDLGPDDAVVPPGWASLNMEKCGQIEGSPFGSNGCGPKWSSPAPRRPRQTESQTPVRCLPDNPPASGGRSGAGG